MDYRMIELILGFILLACFFLPFFLTRKAVTKGFKEILADKEKCVRAAKIKISIFYLVSILSLVAIKGLEIAVRTIDISVEKFNIITGILIAVASISYIISFIFLFIWCNIRCKNKGYWLSSFLLGTITVFPNIYLIAKTIKFSKRENA